MHLVKVSQRYGDLFVLRVIKKDNFEEVVVFPQGKIPLVFKTDSSARMVAKKYLSSKVDDAYSLVVGGCLLCVANKDILDLILKYWKNQGIKLSSTEIVLGVKNENKTDADKLEASVLNDIFSQCI